MNRTTIRETVAVAALTFFVAIAPARAWDRSSQGGNQGISDDWAIRAQAEIIAGEYEISWAQTPADGGGACYQAPNRSQNLRFFFRADGAVHVVDRTAKDRPWATWLQTTGLARGAIRGPVGPARLGFDRNTAIYRHEGLTQELSNDPEGLVQKLVLHTVPGGPGNLRVSVEVGGDVTLHRNSLGGLELRVGSEAVVAIRALEAVDADGKQLDLTLATSASGRGYDLVVDEPTAGG